jgi:hypothetical protein
LATTKKPLPTIELVSRLRAAPRRNATRRQREDASVRDYVGRYKKSPRWGFSARLLALMPP